MSWLAQRPYKPPEAAVQARGIVTPALRYFLPLAIRISSIGAQVDVSKLRSLAVRSSSSCSESVNLMRTFSRFWALASCFLAMTTS